MSLLALNEASEGQRCSAIRMRRLAGPKRASVVPPRYVHYCLRDYRDELEILGRRDLKLDAP